MILPLRNMFNSWFRPLRTTSVYIFNYFAPVACFALSLNSRKFAKVCCQVLAKKSLVVIAFSGSTN